MVNYISGIYFFVKSILLFFKDNKKNESTLIDVLTILAYIISFTYITSYIFKSINLLGKHFSFSEFVISILMAAYYIIDFLSTLYVKKRYRSARTKNKIILGYEYSFITSLISFLLVHLPILFFGVLINYEQGGFDWIFNK